MKFVVRKYNERRPEPVKVATSLKMDDSRPPETIGEELFQNKYVLETRIFTEFWSNGAQLNAKRAKAERMARAYLFSDVLPLLEELILEADSEKVFELATCIKRTLMEAGE